MSRQTIFRSEGVNHTRNLKPRHETREVLRKWEEDLRGSSSLSFISHGRSGTRQSVERGVETRHADDTENR